MPGSLPVAGRSARDVRTLTELRDRFNDSFAAVRPLLLAELTDVPTEDREQPA